MVFFYDPSIREVEEGVAQYDSVSNKPEANQLKQEKMMGLIGAVPFNHTASCQTLLTDCLSY